MKKIFNHNKFEENYFKGYYKGVIGDFTLKDLKISENWFHAWLKVVNKVVPIEDGEGRKVLEIGCSIGGLTSLLVKRGFKVWSSDVSRFIVTNAAKLVPDAKFVVIDVRKKIKLNVKFDLVFATEVLEHLENPDIALKNLYSILQPGGKIIFSSPYPYLWNMNDPTHINVKYPHEWINLMRQVGFQNTTCIRFALIPYFYRFNRKLQFIIPFTIPLPFLNSPILFLGDKL